MHGTFYNQRDRPDYKTPNAFSNDDWIIGVFGTANTVITSIGFNTSKGLVLGPIPTGGGVGDPFFVHGTLLGFFGALQDGAISGFGVWYSPGTSRIPMSMEMSPAYGNLINTWAWDDTPDMGGAHHLFSLFHVVGRKTELRTLFALPRCAGMLS
jgi:hypothetical protein